MKRVCDLVESHANVAQVSTKTVALGGLPSDHRLLPSG
jgi:hypothetical protein